MVAILSQESAKMNTSAVGLLADQLLAGIVSNADNVDGLLRRGAFVLCRRWNDIEARAGMLEDSPFDRGQ
jgi:hypothetical protein